MQESFYLCVMKGKRGYGLTARLTSKQPKLAAGEVVIKLTLDLPTSLFSRPALNASIVIPTDRVPGPVIEADITNNIAEVVKRELGVDMKITIENPES